MNLKLSMLFALVVLCGCEHNVPRNQYNDAVLAAPDHIGTFPDGSKLFQVNIRKSNAGNSTDSIYFITKNNITKPAVIRPEAGKAIPQIVVIDGVEYSPITTNQETKDEP